MENNQIKVSIIVPVKNGEKTIIKTLESIFAQSYDNYECIVVHGDSSDETKKMS